MKVFHLGPTLIPLLHDRGGACERRIIELAAAQAELGHDVTVLSRGYKKEPISHRGFRLESRPLYLRGVPTNYELLFHARRWIRRNRPDVVHVHGIPDAPLIFKGLGVPTVLTVDWYTFWVSERPLRSALSKRYLSMSIRDFDAILPDSNASAELFRSFWGEQKNISVVPEGVRLDQFHPDPGAARAERATRDLEGPVVLYVGRLCEQKGTDVLLDAWEHELSGRGTLVLAGPMRRFGREQEDPVLRDRIAKLGVRYLGAVPEAELAALFNSCDIFVMPTTRAEMFGMAALEAQACGRPLVASRCGGLLDTVGRDAGIFFDPGDSAGLARAVGQLLEDPGLRDRMGIAAAKHASGYGWPSVAARVDAVYEAVTSDAHRTARTTR